MDTAGELENAAEEEDEVAAADDGDAHSAAVCVDDAGQDLGGVAADSEYVENSSSDSGSASSSRRKRQRTRSASASASESDD